MSVKALQARRLALSLWVAVAATGAAGGARAAAADGVGGGAYSAAELRAIETSDERKIRELREQEVTQLRATLGRRLPENRRADLYFRLAEIYLEAYRMEYLIEGRVFDKRHSAENAPSSGVPAAKAIDHSHSRPYLKLGLQACLEILKLKLPHYSRMDEVYYFLGFNSGELGQREDGIRYFGTLTRLYPTSRYAAEAYRAMGDAEFSAGRFRQSIGNYELAVQRSQPDEVARVYHKLAWGYYRIKQYHRAKETMKLAIAATRRSGEKFVSLREEALKDMALFLTESGQVEEALTYFQEVAGDKDYYPRVLESLGKQYERSGEPQKAVQVYESLLKTKGADEGAFRVLAKLVDLDCRRGRYREALARLKDVRVPKAESEETEAATQNLRSMVRRVATEHHERFRKKKERAALEIADGFYTVYLNNFLAHSDPRSEMPEIRMYLAEVRREVGRAQEASDLYRKVVEARDSRYSKEAAALWTASLWDAMRKSQAGSPAEARLPEPSENERNFIEAADALQESLGETAESREAELRAAQILAGYPSSRKEALKRIRKLISDHPRTAQGVTAARLWVQLLTDRLRTVEGPSGALPGKEDEFSDGVEELQKTIREIQGNSELMRADQAHSQGKLAALLAEQDRRLKILSIAAAEGRKEFEEAGRGYEAFAQKSDKKEIAEKALGNAAASYLKAGNEEAAARVAKDWLKRFPGSALAIQAIRSSATHFLIQGDFKSAGELFETLGVAGGDADSLETSARIFEGIGEGAKARELWAAHLRRYPHSPRRMAVTLALAKMKEEAREDGEASKLYRQCMSAPAPLGAECGARLGDLYLARKDSEAARKVFSAVIHGATRGAKSASPDLGYAYYRLALLMEEGASFKPLELPETKLKAAIQARLQFLEPLSRAYQAAVEAGGPWAVASLERLAAWAVRLADEFERIDPSKGAGSEAGGETVGETVGRMRREIQAMSAALRKKAAQTWGDGYSKSNAAGVITPALPRMRDRLANAGVRGVFRAQGFRGEFRLAGIPASGGEAGAQKAMEQARGRLLGAKGAQDPAAWVDYGNLLWGEGKPLLAKIAYDRALGLFPRNPAALNNRAVVDLSQPGAEEDWRVATEASEMLYLALKQDDFFVPAKVNRAALLNYYNLFKKAKPLWEQILAAGMGGKRGGAAADLVRLAQDGLGVALQGLGDSVAAEAAFERATELGAEKDRFTARYHEAARVAASEGAAGAERCLDPLSRIDSSASRGFEKDALERLKEACTAWKTRKQ